MESKKAIERRWTAPEELTLIDLVLSHEEELFGCLKGPVSSSTGRTEQRRAVLWTEIVDTLNSRYTNEKRSIDKVKKKFHNIKQRAKEKIDVARRGRAKTGGGPPAPVPSPAEEALIKVCGDRPGMKGLQGIDTDIICANDDTATTSTTKRTCEDIVKSSSSAITKTQKLDETRRRPKRVKVDPVDEATLENLRLDNERLKSEIGLHEQKMKTLKSQQAAFDSLNLYLSLKMNFEYNIATED